MARQVHDREDLLRDATALVPRMLLRFAPGEVFAGFRSDHALSLYFDAAPVYHFNSRGELRRAFVDDRLLKAENGRLVVLEPQRSAESVEMLSREFSAAELERFRSSLVENLNRLAGVLDGEHFTLVGQVPADGDCLARLRNWLAAFPELRIAASPHVGA